MVLTGGECEALHGTIHRLEQRWQNPALVDPDWHLYDRLPFWDFIGGLRRAGEMSAGTRFIDLGCGLGTNMAIAHHLGWKVSGVDKRAEYVVAARELLPEAQIVCADLMELEELNTDVVYMYRPAKADELEESLEEHIQGLCAPGTVMFWPTRGEVWVR